MVRHLSFFLIIAFICTGFNKSTAQVTGGNNTFEFLRLSNTPHVSALGGIVPAGDLQDISFALQNPGMLNAKMHNQLALGYNIYYAGIGIANLGYAYHLPKAKTTLALNVQYLNYGKFDATDLYGNILGDVRATDYSINISAAKTYKAHWHYGATLKLAGSKLAQYTATAALADIGVAYVDTAKNLTIGLVAKNMGFLFKKYNSSQDPEPLPFDLQLAISKQLKNVPLRLFVVAHHLYQWDIRYDNPADVVKGFLDNDSTQNNKNKSHFGDKLFRHLNFGAELTIGKRICLSIAYSHLKRSELATSDTKGLAGFSFGAGVYLNKLQVHYARSYLATAGAYNEIGFTFQLNKLFNIGNKTEPWHWNAVY